MATKRGLGRGLKSLMQDNVTPEAEDSAHLTSGIPEIPVSKIDANRFQPRKTFDPTALADLAASVKERGVLQPVLVRQAGERFELIAGERRFRAATEVGLKTIPARILDVDDNEALQVALVENVQREDLNVIEEAEGYQLLMDSFGLTQEQVAERVGRSRAAIANALRLLGLPADVQLFLTTGELTAGHAKVLAGLGSQAEMVTLAKKVVQAGLSVRALEKLIQGKGRPMKVSRKKRDDIPGAHVTYLEETLQRHLGTGVHLTSCKTMSNGKTRKGKLEIEYYSSEDLTRILELMGIAELD